MSDKPLFYYTWVFECRRCEKSVTKQSSASEDSLNTDSYAPMELCNCVSFDGKWRSDGGNDTLNEPEENAKWYCSGDCGRDWTEPGTPENAEQPVTVCSVCLPQGLWKLRDFTCRRKPHMVKDSNFTENLSENVPAANGNHTDGASFIQPAEKQHKRPFKKSGIFQSLSISKKQVTSSDEEENYDQSKVSTFKVLGNRSSKSRREVVELYIPSHQLGITTPHSPSTDSSSTFRDTSKHGSEVLIPRRGPEDEDENLEEAKGFYSDDEEEDENSSDDYEVPASLLLEADDLRVESSLMHSEVITHDLQNVETKNADDNDKSIGILNQARGNCRQVHISSPEEELIRLEVDPTTINPADLFLKDAPMTDSDPEQSHSSQEARRLDNAARIQEVRKFFSIPDSLPTSAIPSFINDHKRLGWALEYGIVLTSGGISFRHRYPFIWLLTTRQERLAEINELLYSDTMVWEDAVGREVSETDVVKKDSRAAGPTPEFVNIAPSFDFTKVEGEDEREFWRAVRISDAEGSRLVAEVQNPRLLTDPDSPHGVWQASDLILEVSVCSDRPECGDDEDSDYDDFEE